MADADEVSGLLLCKAGPHRLAFLAEHVVTIEASGAVDRPHARAAFALPLQPGKVIHGEEGAAVTVDALEVTQNALPLLKAPPMVGGLAGGSVLGFAQSPDGLWPILRLREFCQYLTKGRPPVLHPAPSASQGASAA